jgi:hypothetical protein
MAAKKKVLYSIVKHGDLQTIVVTIGDEQKVTESTNPNWDKIVEGAKKGDTSIFNLFEPLKEVEEKFAKIPDQRLSDRLAIRNRRVYWDGDPQNNALSEQLLRFVREGLPFMALVNFYDKISQNPSKNSQEQLYGWLNTHKFTITEDGDILGYKGYRKGEDGKTFYSTTAGHGFVNDQEFNGTTIPCKIGDVVTMPRSEVVDNPLAACSVGLHIGTPSYARGFGNVRVAVLINPRDVVSVPKHDSENKMRVCRYYVLELADKDTVSALKKGAPAWEPKDPVKPEVQEQQDRVDEEVEQPKSEILEDEKPKGKPKPSRRTVKVKGKVTKSEPRGYTVSSTEKVHWNDPEVIKQLKAADTPAKRRQAFPGVSDSTLRKRRKEALSR